MKQLKHWAKLYFTSKYSLQTERIEELNDNLKLHTINGDVKVIITPELKELPAVEEKTLLVLLNTHTNLDFIVKNWDKFVTLSQLTIYFVNPSTNEKWTLHPHTHDKIAEREALRRGLESLFSAIPSVD